MSEKNNTDPSLMSDDNPSEIESTVDETSLVTDDSQTEPKQNIEDLEQNISKLKTNPNLLGRLVLSGKTITVVDNSQRLVGRSDLKKYTKDPTMISRSHFTVYKKDDTFMINNHIKNIQNMNDRTDVLVNGDQLTNNEMKLNNGDKVIISDVEMIFEV